MGNKMLYFCFILCLFGIFVHVRAIEDCTSVCNSMKRDHLTLDMCRDAKKVLPRPKVGDFCSHAMEQAYSDACMDLCHGHVPVSRLAQSCRAASMEMPRPTVRRWCEHGYTQGFEATRKGLATYFVNVDGDANNAADEAIAESAEVAEEKKIVATIPITLDDKVVDLLLHENESAEDAVVVFCRQNLGDDVAACIQELLPIVLQRMDASAQGAADTNTKEPVADTLTSEGYN